MHLFIDRALARRLERAEGAISTTFSEARARLAPERGAAWREMGGAFAIHDGPDSPMTQAFGLGMSEPTTVAEDIAAIQQFFRERGAATHHEISPLAGVATSAMLAERGYRPVELSNVLTRALDTLAHETAVEGALRARRALPSEEAAWVEAAAAGWGANDDGGMREFARMAFLNASMTSFLVELDGAVVGTASLGVHEGIALFAGASTVPSARRRGAQRALFEARVAEAKVRGCEIALMAAEPGSTSQRNAERNGFRVAYTRTKWKLAHAAV